jgi:hypothetical protein
VLVGCHEINFESLDRAENHSFKECDGTTSHEFAKCLILLEGTGQMLLVERRQTNQERVAVGVLDEASGHVWKSSCVEALKALLSVNLSNDLLNISV